MPAVTYIIASTMRTGSYLLCEGLEATGRAGHPREVVCPGPSGRIIAREWHRLPADIGLDDFLRAVLEKRDDGKRCHGRNERFMRDHIKPLAQEAGVTGEPYGTSQDESFS